MNTPEQSAKILRLLTKKGYTMEDLTNLVGDIGRLQIEERDNAAQLQSQEGVTQPKKEDLEVRITHILMELGMPAHIMGYQYARTAIASACEDKSLLNSITRRLYPDTAAKHETTSSRLERAIRHAIEVAWNRGDTETLNRYFGYTVSKEKGKPTNSEFIATIVDVLYLQDKEN